MAIITIPLRNDLFDYSFSMELDTVTYQFKVRYIRRNSVWLLSVGDSVFNIPMLAGEDLLKQFHHLSVPEGKLNMIDLDGTSKDATRTNIGDRVILQYTEI